MHLPIWLVWLSIASLFVALVSAAYILYDIVACKRQMMAVMKWAWPITALYMGPVAVWAYRSMGLSGLQHGDGHGGQQQGSAQQDGRGVSFVTSYPMNWWLIQKGLKEKM